MKTKQVPIEGYCNVYEYNNKDMLGNEYKEYFFGEVCKNKEDLPSFFEYDRAAHKNIGIAKVTIEMLNK